MGQRLRNSVSIHIALVVLLGVLVYSGTLHVPFQFDDNLIVETAPIQSLAHVPAMFMGSNGSWASRPLLIASMALNYSVGGLDTTGYHAFNIALHLINALLLYMLVVMVGRHKGWREDDVRPIAAFAAILFAVHPVQTEAVTYVVSRSMLLATAFYLSGIMLFHKAVTAERRKGFYLLGLFVVSLLGMSSRENFATFPLMLLVYDLIFISGLRPKAVARHYAAYLTVLITLGYLAHLITNNTFDRITPIDESIPPLDYARTQLGVHWTYLRLLVLPINQIVDYNYPVASSLLSSRTALALAGYIGLWGGAVWLARRKPLASFALFWFLITLLPISFGVTIFKGMKLEDVIFEHRLYLPALMFFPLASAGAFKLMGSLGSAQARRALVAMMAVMVIALSAAAYARNSVWHSEESLWADVVAKSPKNARGWNNLGIELSRSGRYAEAIGHFERSITLDPTNHWAWNNMALAFYHLGMYAPALKAIDKAISINPGYVEAWDNKGLLLIASGRNEEALSAFETALKLQPDFVDSWNNKGVTLSILGKNDESLAAFARAEELRPDDPRSWNNKGVVLSSLGRYEEALASFRRAIKLSPDNANAWNNAGLALNDLQRFSESVIAFNMAISLEPSLAEAWNGKGVALAAMGKYDDALAAFNRALQLQPDYDEAAKNRDGLKNILSGGDSGADKKK